MHEVNINGFVYYADYVRRILYEDRERTKGVPFSYLTKSELEIVEKQIRFPKSKK